MIKESGVSTETSVATSRMVHFPISFFSVVMGLCGFTLAWKGSANIVGDITSLWWGLALFTSAAMLVIACCYLVKLVRYPAAVLEEIKHPVRLNFFPSFSISLLLLSIIWQQEAELSRYLWLVGTLVQLLLTFYVMNSWIHHTHYTLSHANPSWFIPVVGNIIVPITGSQLGYTELSWFCFSIGIVFWIVLLTIILYRLFFHEPLATRMTPMLFILLAPPSVGFVSYTSLVTELDTFARVLYYVALFLGLLLASNISRFIKVPFFISSWAYSFPLAALTIATMKMAHLTAIPFFTLLSMVLLGLLTILLTWLLLRTIKAIIAGELCRPE